MNNPDKTETTNTTPTPLRCLTGSLISGGLAIALYSLTSAIAQTFATKPIHSDNPAVINIASAVRTLVVGITALGTGIFGLVALGLIGLAIQILIQQATKKGSPS
ncbi:DUF3082 domain-containing protein [Chroococcidiopsis sp. TS-821]|uniref:DUF3082 domain-containing protein n=1 Tax=Chroococcidiopsis sp. TS-821 TaxID=1378066 RepID=UPI000CEEFA6D|nr:DUF3082 domain-containing protein [Chroococcidiopsis sp. TS-821]PPS44140.1 hypothetical protein B1A85_09225 [Chroococcidiopsis sp. TS-821]